MAINRYLNFRKFAKIGHFPEAGKNSLLMAAGFDKSLYGK